VADDGSREETINLVKKIKDSNPNVKIIHSWQEDDGFRLSMSRNKAIAKATGKYVIIIDGDLILERHFIQDHIENMEKGYFIQGSRVIISEEETKKILKGKLPEFPKVLFENCY